MNSRPLFASDVWERLPPEVQASSRGLEAKVEALETTVRPLPEQRQQHSRTSSRPPSSDAPAALAKRPRRAPTGRRPGGQPGHAGHARGVVPVEQVDVVVPVKPARCRRCQQPWPGEERPPPRPQVPESPPVKPVIPASQWHPRVCAACGAATRAKVPPGVATGGFGPRGQAIIARCTGASHLSQRTTHTVLKDRFGGSLGLGTMANLEHVTTPAVAAPVAEARADVQTQPAAYVDDTGGRAGQHRAWRWTVVTAGVTVLAVRWSRGSQVAHELVGERVWGWLVTDRWRAYRWYPGWRRQRCWAHLARDSEAMVARGGPSPIMGDAWPAQGHPMFHGWPRGRDGTRAQASFAHYMRPVRREIARLLDAGQTCGVPKTAGTGRDLLKRRQAWWTCVRPAGVDPTHNAAERALRPGVLWRQGSFGTHRPAGSRLVEAMMTVVAPLKPQHRPVLDYLTAACQAALRREAAPSLLPTPAAREPLLRAAASVDQSDHR